MIKLWTCRQKCGEGPGFTLASTKHFKQYVIVPSKLWGKLILSEYAQCMLNWYNWHDWYVLTVLFPLNLAKDESVPPMAIGFGCGQPCGAPQQCYPSCSSSCCGGSSSFMQQPMMNQQFGAGPIPPMAPFPPMLGMPASPMTGGPMPMPPPMPSMPMAGGAGQCPGQCPSSCAPSCGQSCCGGGGQMNNPMMGWSRSTWMCITEIELMDTN